MKALITIDYSYDFVANDGALTIGAAAQAIEPELVNLLKTFINDNDDYVVFACDNHKSGDIYNPEYRLFPPHCIIGSPGQKLYGTVNQLYQKYKENKNIYYLPKQHYSAFCGTDLDVKLRERRINEIHLAGLATDICLLHTAINAFNLSYDIVVHENATAGFSPEGHKWAINHMHKVLGAKIVKQ